MTAIGPNGTLRVSRVEVQAAKLKLALDRKRGVPSDPRVVRIANAKPRTLRPAN